MTGIERHSSIFDLAAEMLDGAEDARRQGVATLEWPAGRSPFRQIREAAAERLRGLERLAAL